MKKKNQEIIEPQGGWEPSTWYVVDVSYREGNPIHKSLFFTGFLNKGRPHGYNQLIPMSGPDFNDGPADIDSVKYMKGLRRLISESEAEKIN